MQYAAEEQKLLLRGLKGRIIVAIFMPCLWHYVRDLYTLFPVSRAIVVKFIPRCLYYCRDLLFRGVYRRQLGERAALWPEKGRLYWWASCDKVLHPSDPPRTKIGRLIPPLKGRIRSQSTIGWPK